MIKKIGSFLLVTVMLMAMLTPLTAMAATSGKCGNNLFWILDDSGKLTVTGTGGMWDGSVVWESLKLRVKYVKIEYGVTSIGEDAFKDCENLWSIYIPNSVKSIGEDAFWGCESLVSINIPNSVTRIRAGAFACCYSLESIRIPGSVTSIGYATFIGCMNLTSISVEENNAYYCDVNGVLFSKDRKTICAYPEGKGGISYTIPAGVTSIGDFTFDSCKNLWSIYIPYGVTSIGYGAFSDCDSLTSISIPDSVTNIGNSAFSDCDILTSISIPDSVTSIGNSAFYGCDSLKSIYIPNSVTCIGGYALKGCDNLKDIYYAGSEAVWKSLTMDAGVSDTAKIHYNMPAPPGTIIGSALRTNITAAINGHAIPSFNVDGYTYIVAEDLKDYGFSVYYDNATRTLALSRDTVKTDITRSYVKPYVAPGEVGIKEHDLVATDIVTYLDNNYVQSYNINGQTIIPFNELGRYGEVYYDEGSRTITAIIPGLN